DPDDAREKKARAQTVRAIDAWWKALASKVGDLDSLFSRKKSWDLPRFMQTKLGAIDRRLMWEFGRALSTKNRHRLVITPEANLSLRPLTELVLSRAPKIKGWEFYGYRVAEPMRMVAATVEARLSRPMPEMSVVLRPGEHQTIDLLYLVKGCTGADDSDAG